MITYYGVGNVLLCTCEYISNTIFYYFGLYCIYVVYNKHRGEQIVKPSNKNRHLGDLKSRQKNVLLSATRINDTTKLQGTLRTRKVNKLAAHMKECPYLYCSSADSTLKRRNEHMGKVAQFLGVILYHCN